MGRLTYITALVLVVGSAMAATKDPAKIPASPTASTANAPEISKWAIDKTVSKIDDSQNVTIYASADDTVRGRFSNDVTPIMNFDCREHKTVFYIDFGDLFMASIEGYGDVTTRVDKEPARKISMTESSDHRALGIWHGGAPQFAKSLIGKSKIFIRATPFNESAVDFTISLQGFEPALAALRAACKW